ncbi:MAG: hypothetical protein QOG64_3175, partial [Acidimicrobiaceae bacterium]|nr:hypothetical protein [Acidimicrobiaceae bacterium]
MTRRWALTPYRKNVLLVAGACAIVPWATCHAMPRWFSASTTLTLA